MANNRGFCLIRGPLPNGTSPANGGAILGVQDDRNSGIDLSVDPTNKWWGGPNETVFEVRLFIAHPVPFDGNPAGPNTQPVPGGVIANPIDNPDAGVGFWGSPAATNPASAADYIAIGNNAYRVVNNVPGTFTSDTQVRTWVKSQGYWDNYTGPANSSTPEVPAVQP